MKQEAAELWKNGHHDEAERLTHKALEMMKMAQASDASREETAEKELHSLRGKLERLERAEKLESMARRMRHLQAAAENLKAAEMHDMAHEVMKKAEHLEHELGQAKRELAVAIREFQEDRNAEEARHRQRREVGTDGESPMHRELDALRKELRESQEELKRLRLERDRR
jgi:uncharacterized coiled-coil DUF342 family protein